jgi:hypothetical protein
MSMLAGNGVLAFGPPLSGAHVPPTLKLAMRKNGVFFGR